jgi:tripartite-type tricarboxylate transporter receptor subunit TctC
MKQALAVGTAFVWVLLGEAWAESPDYPAKPVKIITQGATGSGPDVIARIVADHLSKAWGKQVVIFNQPGGGGVRAAQTAGTAEPDGYTLYFPTVTTFVIMPEVQAKLPVDLDRDFVPVGHVAETPMMVAVAPSLGLNSLPELIALAKSRPGDILYAANNRGSFPHLTGELLRKKAGIEVRFVPYQGAAAGLQDLVGGRISMIVESVGALKGAAQGGSVKPLAVASTSRLPSLPNLPTVAETLPAFSALGWFVLMAPMGTPEAIIRKVNEDLNMVLAKPELKQKFQDLGAFVRPMSPAQTGDFIAKEQQTWRPLVRQIGLRAH